MTEAIEPAGLCLVNARVGAATASSLRIVGSRIDAVGVPARPGDLRLDLRGDRVLPGLINAHDHLQLNGLPRLKYRPNYSNVREWIADIEPRLQSEPMFIANHAVPREQRLLIGGVKNLLSGVTTVAHHDPLDALLLRKAFPVRVVARCGWSHSLSVDGAQAVARSYRGTPQHWPWIVHAAEGVDADAAAELGELDALGCLRDNTLIVHGLALDQVKQQRLVQAGAGLIWCPSSNLHLFGRTPDVHFLFEQRRVALGSDSRISGGLDLLAELSVARGASRLDEASLDSLVTDRAAQLLRLPDRGRLEPGALGDIVVLPQGLPLSQACRADIRLVLIGGVPLYADPDFVQALGCEADCVRVKVDGRSKYLALSVAAPLAAAQVREPGLEIGSMAQAAT